MARLSSRSPFRARPGRDRPRWLDLASGARATSASSGCRFHPPASALRTNAAAYGRSLARESGSGSRSARSISRRFERQDSGSPRTAMGPSSWMRCGWYRSAELSGSAPPTLRRRSDPQGIQAPRNLAARQARQFPGRIGHLTAPGSSQARLCAGLRGQTPRRTARSNPNPESGPPAVPRACTCDSRIPVPGFAVSKTPFCERKIPGPGFWVRSSETATCRGRARELRGRDGRIEIARWILCARLIGALQLGPLPANVDCSA